MRNRTLDSTTGSTPPSSAPSSSGPLSSTCSAGPPSGGPLTADDSWFWFITEKGLRASGAASMKSTAASLRETAAELERAAKRLAQEVPAPPNGADEAPVLDCRRGKVCYRYRNERQVPDLRLSGLWLERAGFDRGQKFQIQVGSGRLTIRAESTTEH